MKHHKLSTLLFIAVAAMVLFSFVSEAPATNGYFAHGYSTGHKALGGAGTALPLDSLAASTNPAGMAFVGNRIDLGLSLFNPVREYTVKTHSPSFMQPGTEESGSEWFVIPSFGANYMITANSSLGVSVFGNGGMNTDYDTQTYPGPGASKPTGVDLMQLFVAPTYAVKVHPDHAFGISVIGAFQSFEAQGLGAFAGLSQEPKELTDNGHDDSYGYGARIGYYGKILPGLFLGASYQTQIYMSEYKDYKGLFAEEGDFDIPATWNIGLAYEVTPAITLVFDVQEIYYSDIDSVGNKFNPAFNNCFGAVSTGTSASQVSSCLGGNKGIGFGWDDMTIYKMGVQWKSSDVWTWRAGYSISNQPIPSSEVLFNIIAPGVIDQHATVGFTRLIGSSQELSAAVTYAFENEQSGSDPRSGQSIEIQMYQWEFTVGYAWKF